MSMSPVEIERKLRQLDNDVRSISTMLSAIQGTQERHTNRLGELAEKVDTLDTKVGSLEERLGQVETGQASLLVKVDALDTRLGAVGTGQVAFQAKVDTMDGKLDTVLDLLRSGPTAPA